ncbi:hypothetical protein D3C78_1115710 [compost metagenome]
MLPIEQKAHEILQADRFDLPTQALDGVTMNACQQVTFTPLQCRLSAEEVSAHDIAFSFQASQCLFGISSGQLQWGGDLRGGQGAEATQACAQQFNQRCVGIQRLLKAWQRR